MAENEKPTTALGLLRQVQEANAERLARIQLDAALSGPSGYTLELYEPIMVGAEKKTSLHFRAQTLRDIREKKSDDLLTAELCGLSVEQLQQLSSIDYESTQEVLAGFHLRRAAGGLALKG